MKFSKSTGCFYPEDIAYSALPADIIDVPQEDFDAAMARTADETLDVVAGRVVVVQKPAPTMDELKTAKNAEINAARAAANTGAFDHGGKIFSCDQLSRSDIDGVNGYVALYGALPPAFPGAWKAADNSYYPIADVAAWKAFYASMVATGSANFAHAQELKAQLAAATTPEAIAAIVW